MKKKSRNGQKAVLRLFELGVISFVLLFFLNSYSHLNAHFSVSFHKVSLFTMASTLDWIQAKRGLLLTLIWEAPQMCLPQTCPLLGLGSHPGPKWFMVRTGSCVMMMRSMGFGVRQTCVYIPASGVTLGKSLLIEDCMGE